MEQNLFINNIQPLGIRDADQIIACEILKRIT
jgi:hypothetical protein